MKTHHCEASNGVRLWAQKSVYFTPEKNSINIYKFNDDIFDSQIHYLIDLDLICIYYPRLTILTHLFVRDNRVF